MNHPQRLFRRSATFTSFLGALLSVCSESSFAAKFANQFTEFELPAQWQCTLEGAEWVCQSTNDLRKKDAIIVLAAKIAGPQDTLDHYLTYLKAAKTWTGAPGKVVKSEPKTAKTVNINGTMWIDALHLESEIPGFFTRYLASTKQDIGVLVSLSVSRDKYQEYLSDFDMLVQSLKIFKNNAPAPAPISGGGSGASTATGVNVPLIPESIGNNSVFGPPTTDKPKAPPTGSGELPIVPIALGAAAVVGILILKKRRQAQDE